ncbi:hypothetical protein [Lewinella cohaerens]|uniref:hypothetical protein n=1 Tax=Lewinella cohaerens TaxID=70995 RepID=UPI000366709D|nr:hypothetical protein [Lewinella cohaerens]
MKTISIYFSTLLLLLSISLQAQTRNERKTMSQGVYESIVLEIPDLDAKTVGDLWEDFSKDFYGTRAKYDRRNKEYFSDDAEIAAIGKGNTIDIYTSIEDKGKDQGSELSMWIDLGGAYLAANTHADRYLEAEKMLIRFGLEVAKENVRMQIKAQEKALDDLEDDLKKLGNDKERLERDIVKAQEAIARAEEEIKTNDQSQSDKEAEIKAQQELIEATKRKLKDL